MKNLFYLLEIRKLLALFCCILHTICARKIQYPESAFYGNNYYSDTTQESRINTALGKLDHSLQWVKDWPNPVQLGQVSGVSLDENGHVFVFHRGNNVWDASSFTDRNIYQGIGEPPIPQPTILVFNDTGEVIDMWGQNLFYMPHGITVDHAGNVWVTDVALHQVFKFTTDQREKPDMLLGEKFIPGSDDQHFCKPTSVAVMPNGDFFVADGYCNHRILKFSPEGEVILQWGKAHGQSPFALQVPHALALSGSELLVADRERGRVAVYSAATGAFLHHYHHQLLGDRIFSVSYSPAQGGRIYVVNGPFSTIPVPVRGYVIEMESGRLMGTFAPPGGLHNPHDIAVSPDGSTVYVVEIDPYKIHKFVDLNLKSESELKSNVSVPVKPTATVEVSRQEEVAMGVGGSVEWAWRGGAGAGAAAALLLLTAAALLRARSHGRKSITRRRWEYGHGEFKLRRLLERRRFTRVHSEDSDEEPAPMLQPPTA